jgi:NAD+ synthetase
MCGALAVISDLPKTFVYDVAREINRRAGHALIPESTLTKAPSAELRPDQTDQDTLPPYEVLDPILARYVERLESLEDIVAAGYDEETVRKVAWMVRVNEHKRWQLPVGLKITSKAFGPGRRYPIAQRWRG